MRVFDVALAASAVALSRFANPPRLRCGIRPILKYGFVLLVSISIAFLFFYNRFVTNWDTGYFHAEIAQPGITRYWLSTDTMQSLTLTIIVVPISLIMQTKWWTRERIR